MSEPNTGVTTSISTEEAAERVSFLQWLKNLFTRKNQSPTKMESFTKEAPKKSKVPTKNWVGFGLGIFVMVAAVTASVFFGPAIYTAITGLSAAVIPGLAAITTGLAATIPFVGLAIIAATVLTAFALGLYFTIDSARSLKPQIELSESQNLLDANHQTFVDSNHQTFDPNHQAPITINQDDHQKEEEKQ